MNETVKHKVLRGSKHPRSILTEQEVKRIRELYSTQNYTYKTLAQEYNTSTSNVSEIVLGKTWTHI